ncbi:DNA helicase RecQ [uncultured Methanoregula sp.]|uniref:DNA helicase RecQ n=1 Tax=uncultured Methanoregula sp. TaxID=1005933 RepID=UPI002AAC2C41|nr:DNA helicase RecQ [uncultured Methanoregula sp.]
MDTATYLLKKYWGHTSFLPHQEAIIRSVLDGNDTLAIMATGGGKSLCYQLPALCRDGLTLVISPLISLMKDQVDDLNTRGIPAAAYTSALDSRGRSRLDAMIRDGNLRLLFISPEKCMQPQFLASLQGARITLIAIDEAHCISEWGHNFRPEYRQLNLIKKTFPGVPVIALTATAIPEVRSDIREQLGLSGVREFIGSFNRPNLQYRVIPKKNPLIFLAHYLGQHRRDAGIIYCLSKKETEEVAAELKKRGFPALAYHAGLSPQVRAGIQDAFITGQAMVICATVAFGMGIDKPDVRFVIHYVLPKTVESYYQETGRAGRDGKYSECILLYSRADAARVRSMLEHDDTSERNLRLSLKKLQDIVAYCESTGCRRRFLLEYFGEVFVPDNCGSCDNCDHPTNMSDYTDAARQIALSVQQLPVPFGTEIIIAVLRGAKSGKIQEYNLSSLPVYGSGRRYTKDQYRIWINELIRQGFLVRAGDKYPVISLTGKGHELLKGRMRVMLPIPEPAPLKSTDNPESVTLSPGDYALFLRLKTLRKFLAGNEGVPPFMIFPDKCLHEMVRKRPADAETFFGVAGVGKVKLERYGKVFLREINEDPV